MFDTTKKPSIEQARQAVDTALNDFIQARKEHAEAEELARQYRMQETAALNRKNDAEKKWLAERDSLDKLLEIKR